MSLPLHEQVPPKFSINLWYFPYYLENLRNYWNILLLSTQILQLATLAFLFFSLDGDLWGSNQIVFILSRDIFKPLLVTWAQSVILSSWCFVQKQDVHFLGYLVMWHFVCFLTFILSSSACVHPDFILHAGLSPTWSAVNLQQEETIKGGREMTDSLCWGPMSFPQLSTPRGSSHMSAILAKPHQLTPSRISVYMPELFSSVCPGTKIHSQTIESSIVVSTRFLTRKQKMRMKM